MKIHIMGASGAGKTYLGKKLSEKLNYLFVDTDDIIWEWGDNIVPYTKAVPDEESSKILKEKLEKNRNVIVSGLFYPWGENVIDDFDLLIYLTTPINIRKKRLIDREIEMYGDRVSIDGDMRKQFDSFLEWACQYDYHNDKYCSKIESEKWIKKFHCPKLYLDGSESLEKKMVSIINAIINISFKKTPCYIFDLDELTKNCNNIKNNLPYCELYYALKANNNNKIIDEISKNNYGFEISSYGEYKLIKKYEKEFICSLPIKSSKLIKKLYEDGCRYFVYDTLNELEKIKKYAPQSKKILRINITKIKENTINFGMDFLEFKKCFEKGIINSDEIDGFTFYLSNNYNYEILDKVLNYLEKYLHLVNKNNIIINIGGNYRTDKDVDDAFYLKLNRRLQKLKKKYTAIIIAEPGHGIVRTSGMFITNVIELRKVNNKIQVFIDSGSPHGLHMTPKKIFCINEIKEKNTDVEYDFYGMLCDYKLIFSKKLNYQIKIGDKLLFTDYGSYTQCYINNFHAFEKPKFYYISDNKILDFYMEEKND